MSKSSNLLSLEGSLNLSLDYDADKEDEGFLNSYRTSTPIGDDHIELNFQSQSSGEVGPFNNLKSKHKIEISKNNPVQQKNKNESPKDKTSGGKAVSNRRTEPTAKRFATEKMTDKLKKGSSLRQGKGPRRVTRAGCSSGQMNNREGTQKRTVQFQPDGQSAPPQFMFHCFPNWSHLMMTLVPPLNPFPFWPLYYMGPTLPFNMPMYPPLMYPPFQPFMVPNFHPPNPDS